MKNDLILQIRQEYIICHVIERIFQIKMIIIDIFSNYKILNKFLMFDIIKYNDF
jgi:hypothetical protein